MHGGHIKSIKYRASEGDYLRKLDVVADAGTRISIYIYINALPSSTSIILAASDLGSAGVELKLTSAGVLQLARWDNDAQIGSDGATLSTGIWYRISLAYTITSITVNRFEVFKDGISTISVTNATIGGTGGTVFWIGNLSGTTLDMRSSDHYIDNSNSLTDTGDIWVTAKRPNANGTTNGFTTQIGLGGSGYGLGHSPQVNERPLSTSNGWSIITVASPITEEYNIESASTGDVNLTGATIIDYLGWVSTTATIDETAQIIVNNAASNISIIGNTYKLFTKIVGSTTYPAGMGTDIGIISSNIATTINLYECGVIVAYIPAAATASSRLRSLLGVGL